MKRQLSYPELLEVAKRTAEHIKYCYGNEPNAYSLIAVSRGGLSFAHAVAYYLAKPLAFFFPSEECITPCPPGDKYIFLEDVIATGRTVKAINSLMCEYASIDYEIFPVVVDAALPMMPHVNCVTPIITSDWIVFPHEDFDATVEGDHGLFREGTSENSKALV